MSKLRAIQALIQSQNLLHIHRITKDMQTVIRMQFLYAAIESGLLHALTKPSTRAELIQKLDVSRFDILDALLDVGCALKELAYQHGQYVIIGKRAKSLVAPNGDALVAIVQANCTYYHSVYQLATERLHGAPSGQYLDDIGDIVARIGKITEPFVQAFVEETVANKGALRLLDIGCGSGIYLRTAHAANSQVFGMGMDRNQHVVQQAKANLEQWGLHATFHLVVGDIRHPPTPIRGQFDGINMSNIIYYFVPEERMTLFTTLYALLRVGGFLALVTTVQSHGTDVVAASLNMATSSMIGCTPLPDKDAIMHQLQASGFSQIRATNLVPGSAFYGITAWKQPVG